MTLPAQLEQDAKGVMRALAEAFPREELDLDAVRRLALRALSAPEPERPVADDEDNRCADKLLYELGRLGVDTSNWDGDEGVWPSLAKCIAMRLASPPQGQEGAKTHLFKGWQGGKCEICGVLDAYHGTVGGANVSAMLAERLQAAMQHAGNIPSDRLCSVLGEVIDHLQTLASAPAAQQQNAPAQPEPLPWAERPENLVDCPHGKLKATCIKCAQTSAWVSK